MRTEEVDDASSTAAFGLAGGCAAVVAAFVYLTANRDQKLPRKAPPTVQ